MYTSGNAHLNRVAQETCEDEVKASARSTVSDASPRSEDTSKISSHPRSAGVLDFGGDVKALYDDGSLDSQGGNPSQSDNLASEQGDNMPNYRGSRRSNGSKSVVIGETKSASIPQRQSPGGDHAINSKHSSSYRSLSELPKKTPRMLKLRNVVRAVQEIRDAHKRSLGDLVFTIDNAEKEEMHSEEFDISNIRGLNADEPYDWRRKRQDVDKVLVTVHLLINANVVR